MITFHRSVRTLPGKFPGAVAVAKEMCAMAREITGVDVSLSVRIGGPGAFIRWSATYDSLAVFEAALAKLLASPKYWELLEKLSTYVADTGSDELWRSV